MLNESSFQVLLLRKLDFGTRKIWNEPQISINIDDYRLPFNIIFQFPFFMDHLSLCHSWLLLMPDPGDFLSWWWEGAKKNWSSIRTNNGRTLLIYYTIFVINMSQYIYLLSGRNVNDDLRRLEAIFFFSWTPFFSVDDAACGRKGNLNLIFFSLRHL